MFNEKRRNPWARIPAISAFIEVVAGLLVMLDPALAIPLLLGVQPSSVDIVLGRSFGIAILALGAACWPVRSRNGGGAPALRGLLVYNVPVALWLAYVATSEHVHAPLLWPAIALHGTMALLLAWSWHASRRW